MLMVKTILNVSGVHGIGLFADQDISKGDIIWAYHKQTCQKYRFKEFLDLCYSLPLVGIQNLINYSYIKNHKIYYITDNTRFINHSLIPNIELLDNQVEIAMRDIKRGEELLENYNLSYDVYDFFNNPEMLALNNKAKLLSALEDLYYNNKYIPQAL